MDKAAEEIGHVFGDPHCPVVAFKNGFYRCPWARYEDAKPRTFRLMPTEEGSKRLESDYRNLQVMAFRAPPLWLDILDNLKKLESEIYGLVENRL